MSDGTASGGQIKELKVSGHTMALDDGLYCVFNTPGGVAGADGLPGVRITAAPGGGQVSIASFHADGWIGIEDGALVRVSGGPAEVMVTVYQAKASTMEAPKLQVVRLSGDAAPAKPAATRAAPKAAPKAAAAPVAPAAAAPAARRGVDAPDGVEVMAHIYSRGDVGGPMGEWMGEPGSQRWIEGFGIAPLSGVALEDIEYQAVLGRGWLSPWSVGGQFCGSRGMSLPILGLRVRLRGEAAETHRAVLSASFVDGTRIGPVGDGDACEAPSLAALESFQVAFVPVTAAVRPAAPKAAPKAAAPKAAAPKAAPKSATPKAAAPKVAAPKPVAAKAAAKPAVKAASPAAPAAKPGKPAAKAAPQPQPEVAKPAAKGAKAKAAAPKAEPAPAPAPRRRAAPARRR